MALWLGTLIVKHFVWIGMVGLLLSFASPTAQAVHLEFTGVIDSVVNTPPAPFEGVTAGDAFTLAVDYNAAAADQAADPDVGVYLFDNLTITIGTAMDSTTIGSIAITNSDEDSFAITGSLPSPIPNYSLSFGLTDFDGSVFSGDDLPTAVNPADFDFATFSMIGLTGGFTITGTVNDVPAPASLSMLAAGAVMFIRRRKQSPRHPSA